MMEKSVCGCCEGIHLSTPRKIENRSGLATIGYRIGEYADFKNSLLSKLTISQLEQLKKLTTRADDDFTVALLDAFAVLSDVLTFYQERIANESYLKTATERLSIAALAATIGYELNPGVAATTYLSFTLEENSLQTGEDRLRGIKSSGNERPIVNLEKGVKAQSIPEQDEEPQIFETVEDIEAKSDWNAMKVQTSVAQESLTTATSIYLSGTSNTINKGDHVLIIEGEVKRVKPVLKVELLNDIDTTAIHFESEFQIFIFQPQYFLFQMNAFYNAPYHLNTDTISEIAGSGNAVSSLELQSTLAIQNWNTYEFRASVNNPQPQNSTKVFVFRNRAALFGYNAPPKITNIADNGDVTTTEHSTDEDLNILTLDAEYPEVVSGANAHIAIKTPWSDNYRIHDVDKVQLRPQTKYGISGKSTEISFSGGADWSPNYMSTIRGTMVYIQNEEVGLVRRPLTQPITAGSSQLTLSQYYIDLKEGQKILVSGESEELPGIIRTEIHTIKKVELVNRFSRITLEKSLSNTFVRSTVTVNANVAFATHGETVTEVLGSGDARIPFQKFTLKHSPITYVADASPSGSSSTVEVTVNDIRWQEVPYFYRRKPNEQVYILRTDNEGATSVIFGDGIHGSRLPTGNLNIRAVYRKGIGAAGLVKSNQISQLISKPLYVKTVNNPIASAGAQSPEDFQDARSNANVSIRTLDRIVSLKDYEDFARAFAGIEKANAVWLWTDNGKKVHITVAGANGAAIEQDSTLMENLRAAIIKMSYPGIRVEITSYRKRYFRVKGNLNVLEAYDFEKVHTQVIEKLKDTYAFKNRNLGQHIYLSELIAHIESIEGVNYIDIDSLFITGQPELLNKRLTAQVLNAMRNNFDATELIMLDPSPTTFTEAQ